MKKRSGFSAVHTIRDAMPPVEWLALVDPRVKKLTVQEIAVLARLRNGLSDKMIADSLELSVASVRFHLGHACKKIGAASRIEAALWADRNFFPPGFLRAAMK